MVENNIAAFKEKLRGPGVFGPFMKTGDPAFVEAAGWAGMDFAILDTEHGPVSLENMQNNIRAAQVAGMLPIIRTATLGEEAISKALDIGAAGVQIPQVATAEDARFAVRAAKYHPLGMRGVCRFVRAARYSATPAAEYFPEANEALVIIQLEGRQAVENLDAILAVEGVDIAFIGPYDLSQSLGLTGQTGHPKVVAEMEKIVAAAAKKGVVVGTFTDSRENLELWKKAGVKYLSYSTDVGIFTAACSGLRQMFDTV